MHMDDLGAALEALNKAAELAEKGENIKPAIDNFNKFGFINLELGKRENAIFYIDRVARLLKSVQYPYGEAVHKYLMARLKLEENYPLQAMELIDEATKLSNDKNLTNNLQMSLADIFLFLDRFDDAEKIYNSLLVNSDDLERFYLEAKANLGLANLNFEISNLEKSVEYGERALQIANQNNYHKLAFQANEFLTTGYESLGQYDRSLLHLKNLVKVKDSSFTIEKVKEQTKTTDRITIEQLKNLTSVQEEKIEKLSQSENRAEITAILTSAFLTIISLLAVSLYRNNQIKIRTNDLLQTKNSELEKARDDAISAMKAKSNFLSTVTHELRTPLYAVTGLTHILLEENPAAHQKEHLKSLKFSGDYLLNFINDILQINKIDADKVEPLKVEFKLKNVLTDVIDSLQQNAVEQETKLILNYDNTIPMNMLGDPLKLSQIFINLVGNALKFTKNGNVDVMAKLIRHEGEQVKIHFEVKDDGIGISEEQQKKIFDSFEQGSIQINREYGGTGLGLTIVKSLLGLFDSKIQLESQPGFGSRFFFEIEFKSEEPKVVEVTPNVIDPEKVDFSGMHLLIVEDNKINQVITKKMLVKKEMTCDIANNGFEAVDKAKETSYDCILMDIHMPGMGGTEATMEIRKFNKEVPIIALTAISMEDSVEEFINAGCNDVVTKPFKPEVFYEKIAENIIKVKTASQA
ncbi:response regulator [Muricauda sp. DJ-13]|uniref:histidine kinase n=2 Tax=Croceivirga thetidis TaxID=2721623 RepID=A0ABX1GTQ8_9FLAO|nr:response regulator [Croceivirga thetidis]